jgi:hypothetical protein
VGEIHFPNGNRAGWVRASPEEEAAPLLRALGREQPRALLLLLGGADAMAPESEARLRQLFSRGLATAADESGALVMDGGTHTGIMALMGLGMAGRARRASLLGVVPEGRITWPGRPAGAGLAQGSPLAVVLIPREGPATTFKRLVLRHLQKASYLTYQQAEGRLLQMRDALARLHARQDTPSQEAPSKAPHPSH